MIPAPLIPYLLLGALLLVLGVGAGGYWKGYQNGEAHVEAQMARDAATARAAQEEALRIAAEQMLQLDVKNTTIRQKTEVVTREIPVYRDCRHDPDAYGLLNDALAPGTVASPDQGELPRADAAR